MKLTRAEEKVMLILWEMKKGVVKDIRNRFSDPKPARNTVSTVLRVLERKGFVGHKSYSNVFQYRPVVSREEYSGKRLHELVLNYFDGSFTTMASFYAHENELSVKDLERQLKESRKGGVKLGKKKNTNEN